MIASVRESAALARNIAGIGSSVPIAFGGLGVGVLRLSRRDGVNFFTTLWPGLLLKLGGVSINVTGQENLTAQRPAVFIFNHRNNFDSFIPAALVRDNWTAVGR